MGQCYGKVAITEDSTTKSDERDPTYSRQESRKGAASPYSVKSSNRGGNSPFLPASPLPNFANSPLRNFGTSPATPRRFFRRPFPPPSPAKHIQSALAKRHGVKPKEGSIPEGSDVEKPLDKNFGYGKHFTSKYELGHEVGQGHFGHTCVAKVKKGDLKGQSVAVKIIAKAKMTTAISVEDVRREVKILKALSGHHNLVRFFDACEDSLNVYIVMELCEGGELLERILARGGKYTEEDAKVVVIQILSIVSFCHLQGVVHRDLKPENFLFTTRDENAALKAIDFGLSDFIKPEERLNDIVGSAYYVAPEVLHRSYSTEADVWSVGVISYILLCGSRPFWARTESGIFRAVIQAEPNFVDKPWPVVSPEAIDFVKRLLNKDLRKRMSAAQALTHPWIRGDHKVPLDMLVYRLVKSYLRSSSLKRAALKSLSKSLNEEQVHYLRCQFALLEPNKSGRVSFENFKTALLRNATEAMKESRSFDILSSMDALDFKKMDFQEFCAAAISVHQLEALVDWEDLARKAYETFDKEGNRAVKIEEIAREVGLGQAVPAHVVLRDCVRQIDGKLSFIGFKKLLHGVTSKARSRLQ